MGSRRAASTLNKEGRMRTVLAIAVAMSLVAGTISVASAADEKKPNPQQQRMKACNAQAGDKKGDERRAFIEGTRMDLRMPPAVVENVRKTVVLGRGADVKGIAAQMETFCRADSVTGQVLVVDGGLVFH